MRRKFHNAWRWLDIKIHYLSLQEWAEGEHRDRTTGGNRGPFPPRQFVYPLVRTARNLWISGTRPPRPRVSATTSTSSFLETFSQVPRIHNRSAVFSRKIPTREGQPIRAHCRLSNVRSRFQRTEKEINCVDSTVEIRGPAWRKNVKRDTFVRSGDRRGNKRKRSSKRRRAIYHTRFTDSLGETSLGILLSIIFFPFSPRTSRFPLRNSMLLIKMQMSRQFRNSNGLSVSTRLRCLGRHNVDMPRINNRMVEHRRTI